MRFFSCFVVVIFFTTAYSGFPQAPNLLREDALQNYRVGRELEARDRMDEAQVYYNEAIRICNAELAANPANMDSYTVLTWALRRQEKYREVITWGERGLGVNAEDYRIIETMGEAYFHLYNYAESLRYLQRYVNSQPQGERASVAYFYIGEIFRLQQRYRHADIAYTTALRLDPGLALWWYRLGQVRESAGDTAPAADAYERALQINPAYQEASDGLARVRS
jgi:tetratricopeptide (TPR) repeat protein